LKEKCRLDYLDQCKDKRELKQHLPGHLQFGRHKLRAITTRKQRYGQVRKRTLLERLRDKKGGTARGKGGRERSVTEEGTGEGEHE